MSYCISPKNKLLFLVDKHGCRTRHTCTVLLKDSRQSLQFMRMLGSPVKLASNWNVYSVMRLVWAETVT